MAHHGRTPKSVLEAPTLTPRLAWDPHREVRGLGRQRPTVVGAFRSEYVTNPRKVELAGRRKARAAANRAAKRGA